MQKIINFLIKGYQYLLSPLKVPCCRFYPCCSDYALLALERWGVSKGLWNAVCRLLRCHPWSHGGYDPVPPKNEHK